MIIVDTSVWVDFFNDYESQEKMRLEKFLQNGQIIFTTGIIVSEVLSGIRSKKMFSKIEKELRELHHVEPAFETYVYAAEIYKDLRSKGITIRSIIDCLIAAMAIENNLKILHKDCDFKVIHTHYPSLFLVNL